MTATLPKLCACDASAQGLDCRCGSLASQATEIGLAIVAVALAVWASVTASGVLLPGTPAGAAMSLVLLTGLVLWLRAKLPHIGAVVDWTDAVSTVDASTSGPGSPSASPANPPGASA